MLGSRSAGEGVPAPFSRSSSPEGRAASSLAGVFTGIVRELARVVSLEGDEEQGRLVVAAPRLAPELWIGDSVAVDGCCLTVVEIQQEKLAFDLSAETLSRS